MVSWSGCPSTASTRNSSRVLPSEPTALTAWPGVPRSCSSYRSWSPDRPATSPTSNVGVLLDHLGRHLADRPEDRRGEAPWSAPAAARRDDRAALDPAYAGEHAARHLVLAVDDRLDEGERSRRPSPARRTPRRRRRRAARARGPSAPRLALADLGCGRCRCAPPAGWSPGPARRRRGCRRAWRPGDQVEGDRLGSARARWSATSHSASHCVVGLRQSVAWLE